MVQATQLPTYLSIYISESGAQLQMVQATQAGQKKIGIPITVTLNEWSYLAIRYIHYILLIITLNQFDIIGKKSFKKDLKPKYHGRK